MTSWKKKKDNSEIEISNTPPNIQNIELFETFSPLSHKESSIGQNAKTMNESSIGQPDTTTYEGFEIFDDNYFKNCSNWIDQLSNEMQSLGMLDGYREFIKYLTCPLYSFDSLLLNYIFHTIRYVYLAYCESHKLEPFIDFSDTLESDSPSNSSYPTDSPSDSESPYPTNSPSDSDSPYPTDSPSDSESPYPTDSPSDSNFPLDSSYSSKSPYSNQTTFITKSNRGFDKLTSNQQQSVNTFISNHLDWIIQNNDLNDPFTQNIINVIIETYILNYTNYFKQQSSSDFENIKIIEFDMFFNMQLSDSKIINDIKTQAIALNPSIGTLPSINTSDTGYNSNPNNIENDINLSECQIKLNKRRKEFMKCAKIIRDEIYTILQIPIMIFIAYNIYFVFFFINEYNRPEIYFPNIHLNFWLKTFSGLSDSIQKEYEYVKKNGYVKVDTIHRKDINEIPDPTIKKKTSIMDMVYFADTRTFFHVVLDFIFEIFWKPYIFIHTMLERYRNKIANIYIDYNLSKYTWLMFYTVLMGILFSFNYIHGQIVFIGNIIEGMISGQFGIYDIVVNSAFYAFIFSFCFVVVCFAFLFYIIKLFTIDIYTVIKFTTSFPFSLMYFIAEKLITIIMRFICVMMLITPSIVLCVMYCVIIFIGAMRYFSVRANISSTMNAINRSIYTSIFQDIFKPTSNDPRNPHNHDPKSKVEQPKNEIDPMHIAYEIFLMIPKYQFVYLLEFPILSILIAGIYTYETNISDPNVKQIMIIINSLAIVILLFFMWNKGFRADHNGFSLLGSWKKLEIIRIFSGFIDFFKINKYDTKSILEEIYGKD